MKEIVLDIQEDNIALKASVFDGVGLVGVAAVALYAVRSVAVSAVEIVLVVVRVPRPDAT